MEGKRPVNLGLRALQLACIEMQCTGKSSQYFQLARYMQVSSTWRTEHVDDPVNTELSKGKHCFVLVHGLTEAGRHLPQKLQRDLADGTKLVRASYISGF
jgi:hypothetical protein